MITDQFYPDDWYVISTGGYGFNSVPILRPMPIPRSRIMSITNMNQEKGKILMDNIKIHASLDTVAIYAKTLTRLLADRQIELPSWWYAVSGSLNAISTIVFELEATRHNENAQASTVRAAIVPVNVGNGLQAE